MSWSRAYGRAALYVYVSSCRDQSFHLSPTPAVCSQRRQAASLAERIHGE